MCNFARKLSSFACIAVVLATGTATAEDRPHVVLIYADDLGYGDVSCYGATEITTPNIDQLAQEGLRFTDGHSASATCTPSRYAMLTGEYAWRRKGTGVLSGNARLIIEPGRTTLASLLKSAGYKTGVVGKWHLGLGDGNLDWNGEIKPGPLEIGFDYCFLVPATGDRVPCVYVENHRVVGLEPYDPIEVRYDGPVGDEPTGKARPVLLKLHPSHGHDMTIVNGISRIGYMSGGQAARWVDEEMADTLTAKAVGFIERSHEEQFFLFFSLHDIHVPRVPHPRFVGQSGMGPRGDAILQLDWCVGQITATLDRLDIADETLVIFTSDNGPVVDDGYRDDAVEKLGAHRPAGLLRGGKYSAFEGGTRVPFIVRWPGHVAPGASDALMCQIDFLRSVAALVEVPLAGDDAPDSENQLDAFAGKTKQGREQLVEHARTLALRQGPWKYIAPADGPAFSPAVGIETGLVAMGALYDLASDPGERHNLTQGQPKKVAEMAAELARIRRNKAERGGDK